MNDNEDDGNLLAKKINNLEKVKAVSTKHKIDQVVRNQNIVQG